MDLEAPAGFSVSEQQIWGCHSGMCPLEGKINLKYLNINVDLRLPSEILQILM